MKIYKPIPLEKGKYYHIILGHYNRFDIFDLRVNVAPTKKITFVNKENE